MRLPARFVWVERVAVFLVNVAVNVGLVTSDQEHAITGGGVIGVLTLVQVLSTVGTHLRASRSNTVVTDIVGAYEALRAAGKAS